MTDGSEKKDKEMNEPQANEVPSDQTPVSEASVSEMAPSREKELEAELLYLRAEFDNSRKRMMRDQETSLRFANERFIKELLGVVDLFDRALGHSENLKSRKEDAEATNFVTGIELTHRELIQVFTRMGVEFTGTKGEKFDPTKHEAISQMPVADDKVDTVVEVAQKGCLYQGRLLKPARVVVGIKQSSE